MKVTLLTLAAGFAAQAYGAACPFGDMKSGGFLNEEDSAKFDAVKRDPSNAEKLYQEHRARRREMEEGLKKRKLPKHLIGPKKHDGQLDLPLGGGLRKWSGSARCREENADRVS